MTAWGGGAVLCALAAISAFDGDASPWTVRALAWGALLLSFMGGARWGYALKAMGGQSSFVELGAALVPAAVGWAALLAQPLHAAAIQILGFLFQAVWDLLAGQTGRLPDWAVRVRVEAAAIAIVGLLALTAGLILR